MALRFFIFLLFFLCSGYLSAQNNKTAWFPEKPLFEALEYDLLETQPFVGVFYLKANNTDYRGAFIPVNLGIRKSFIQWEMLHMKFDFAMGAASYTQFEIIKYDANTLRGGLLNTDFKASGFINAQKGSHYFRIQLFHISSHLGDDYMLRNDQFELNNKTVNYEQLDLTYLYKPKNTAYYIGVGEVITPHSFRQRFMMELGIQGSYPLRPLLDLVYGSDVKLYHENNFVPDVHSGLGVAIKQRGKHQVNFTIDSYFGQLPYSTLDFGSVFWLGLSGRIML